MSTSKSEHERTISKKNLVVYFSATGVTKTLAEYAAEISNADIYEIVPKQAYTKADLAYYTNGRANQEQSNKNARLEILDNVENIEKFSVIPSGMGKLLKL